MSYDHCIILKEFITYKGYTKSFLIRYIVSEHMYIIIYCTLIKKQKYLILEYSVSVVNYKVM